MSRAICFTFLIVAVAFVNGKNFGEVQQCFKGKAQECTNTCKKDIKGFPIDKLAGCLNKVRGEATGNLMKTCLEKEGIKEEELKERECWKPSEADSEGFENKLSQNSPPFPAAKKLMTCAKDCMKDTNKICHEGCNAELDKKVTDAVKKCSSEAMESAKPLLKTCMLS